jgi:hypothetical protein
MPDNTPNPPVFRATSDATAYPDGSGRGKVAKTETGPYSDAQKRVLDRTPDFYRGHFKRAYSGGSRKAAIHAFCLECVGFLRSEVTHCTAKGCPLYPYRPYSHGEDADAETE